MATWTWNISPEKAGNHKLLLNLNTLTITPQIGDWRASIKVNDAEPKQIRDVYDKISLPVIVLTDEGVTLQTYLAIRYTLIAIGAILLYPAVSSLITGWLNKPKDNSGTAQD